MLQGIGNAFTNQAFVSLSQNTKAALSIETALKATGRPSFILMDDELDKDTKKYAATKEFLYQAICLALYLTLIIPIFKKGTFGLLKNKVFKDEAVFKQFKNADQYLDYRTLADLPKPARLEAMKSEKKTKNLTDGLKKTLKEQDNPEKYFIIKGAIEVSSTIGSVLGLAIVAPQISHFILHPIMDWLGIKKKDDKNHSEKVENNDNNPVKKEVLDKKA